MKVKIKNLSAHTLPEYQTDLAAGLDLRANLEEEMVLASGERALVPTGLFIEIPKGFEAQVRPRSGLAYRHGITVLNSPGTIDADYRGEVMVLLINHSEVDFTIENGERIAQLVVAAHARIEWESSVELNQTERGYGGMGSTGRN